MLVYSDRYRGWGKQKPAQWGPFSAVQASLFKNAERIGIDPEHIEIATPVWTPGDQVDYSKHVSICHNVNGVFDKDELVLEAVNSAHLQTVGPIVGLGDSGWWSFLLWADSAPRTPVAATDFLGAGSTGSNRTGIRQSNVADYRYSLTAVSAYQTAGFRPDFFASLGAGDSNVYFAVIKGEGKTLNLPEAPANITVPLTQFRVATRSYSSAGDCINMDVRQWLVLSQILSIDVVERLYDAPYELWQPVPQTSFFDLGAGGIPISLLYDLRAMASNQYIFAYDQEVAVSTSRTQSADTELSASNALADSYDTELSARTLLTLAVDSLLSAANELTESYDTKLTVGTQDTIIVPFDTLTTIRNSLTRDFDTRLSVGTQDTIVVPFDTETTVSNELTQVFDTSTIVSGLITVIETFDTRLDVSTIKEFLFDTLTSTGDGQCVNLCQNDIDLIVDMVVARLEPIIEANSLSADEVWRYER